MSRWILDFWDQFLGFSFKDIFKDQSENEILWVKKEFIWKFIKRKLFFAVIALLALAAIASAQTNICDDQVLLFGRDPDDCSRHFTCMLGQRVDFQCDPDFIYDVDRRRCRLGSWQTCEFRFGVRISEWARGKAGALPIFIIVFSGRQW